MALKGMALKGEREAGRIDWKTNKKGLVSFFSLSFIFSPWYRFHIIGHFFFSFKPLARQSSFLFFFFSFFYTPWFVDDNLLTSYWCTWGWAAELVDAQQILSLYLCSDVYIFLLFFSPLPTRKQAKFDSSV
ncbi:hypothetical protein BDD12DRAFT_144147 [Trichophaea hybrida]|nr:hypothetical protein BDD12DRAFT_144147 [Trichophaea hybrida]